MDESLTLINVGDVVEFDYTNWKGVQGHRRATVVSFAFGESPFHPGYQLLMCGEDHDKNKDVRLYATSDMTNVVVITKRRDAEEFERKLAEEIRSFGDMDVTVRGEIDETK